MTIDMSTTRTDLALESVQAACSGAETGTISGVRSRERTREGYAVTDIRVEDEDGAQALGKPVGRYVTVDLGPYFRREADYFDRGSGAWRGSWRRCCRRGRCWRRAWGTGP